MCVLIFLYFLCLKHLTLRRMGRYIVVNINRSSRKVPVFLSDFKFKFLDRFFKNTQVSNFMLSPSGSRAVPCGRTDGQKDRHSEVNFRNIANCLKPTQTILKVLHKLNVYKFTNFIQNFINREINNLEKKLINM
jgi:hypothetical protein